MNPFETDLERRMRARYAEASRQLDPTTAQYLQQARQQALDTIHRPLHKTRLLLPASAFAVVALAAIVVWQPSQRTDNRSAIAPVKVQHGTQAENSDRYLPPDADSDDARLYQDLDFYGWLASTDNSNDANSHR